MRTECRRAAEEKTAPGGTLLSPLRPLAHSLRALFGCLRLELAQTPIAEEKSLERGVRADSCAADPTLI